MSLLSSLSLYCLINMTIPSYIKKSTDNIEDCFYIYLINDKHLKTKSSLLKPNPFDSEICKHFIKKQN